MKVPGIEEMQKTFLDAANEAHGESWIRLGLLAVFETHVKGMLAEAWLQCITKIDGSFTAFDERDANEYADRAIAQLKEPRHD